jgi:hypothetical protein
MKQKKEYTFLYSLWHFCPAARSLSKRVLSLNNRQDSYILFNNIICNDVVFVFFTSIETNEFALLTNPDKQALEGASG